MDSDKLEAVQNVIDRVSAYQDSATDSTVEKELRDGLNEAGVELDDDQVRTLVSEIEENPGEARAADLLS
jgi:hypothetical protein